MKRTAAPFLILSLVLAVQPATAFAYIGPGAAFGAIAAVVGVIGSVLLAIVAVLYYPIKRMLKGGKNKVSKTPAGDKTAK